MYMMDVEGRVHGRQMWSYIVQNHHGHAYYQFTSCEISKISKWCSLCKTKSAISKISKLLTHIFVKKYGSLLMNIYGCLVVSDVPTFWIRMVRSNSSLLVQEKKSLYKEILKLLIKIYTYKLKINQSSSSFKKFELVDPLRWLTSMMHKNKEELEKSEFTYDPT